MNAPRTADAPRSTLHPAHAGVWILTIRDSATGEHGRYLAHGRNPTAAAYWLAVDLGRDFLVVAAERILATPADGRVFPSLVRTASVSR